MIFDTEILEAVEREACLNSFYEFFISFWGVIVQEDLIVAPHIEYICDELQSIAVFIRERKKKPHDLIINVPPGSTKTTIVLQMYPAWLWAIDPTIRIISSSHSGPLSIESASKSRDIIMSPKYQKFFPHVVMRGDKSAKKAYENTKGGTRDATSTGSAITGRHAHIKLMDDLQEISKAASTPHRYQAVEHMKTLFTREVEKGNSINVLIMQRLHELDCTKYLLSLSGSRKVKHICLPAEYSEKVSPSGAKKLYKNGLLDSVRMSKSILSEKRAELGTYGYASQFEQDPTPPEGGMIKRKWFQFVDRASTPISTSAPQFFVDTAYEKKKNVSKATGEARNDPTGLISTQINNGICYITSYEEVYMELPDLVRYIPTYCKLNGYKSGSLVRIEPKASGKSTVQTIRSFSNLNVKEIEGGKDSKETELTNASPSIEAGRFVLVRGAWNDLFLDRVCGFPYAAHDEAVDLLCYAKKHYFGGGNSQITQTALEKALKMFG